MFVMGLVVGLGLLVTLVKASAKVKVAILSNPLAADIIIFVFLCALHWGTFSGIMVATIGALVCSCVLSLGRKVYGYKKNGLYFRGMVNLADRLGKRTPVAAFA